jgi:hypothetical protein
MSSSPQPAKSREFTDRTPGESICMTCYATVRAPNTESLQTEQQRHKGECTGEIGRVTALAR